MHSERQARPILSHPGSAAPWAVKTDEKDGSKDAETPLRKTSKACVEPHPSDILDDILNDILSDMLSDTLFDTLIDVLSRATEKTVKGEGRVGLRLERAKKTQECTRRSRSSQPTSCRMAFLGICAVQCSGVAIRAA